jgi:hypothetical protein
MDKYLWILTVILMIGVLVLTFIIYRFNKHLNSLLHLALTTAREHNRMSYEFSKFIVASLQEKAKQQNLTEEEQALFHDARHSIHQYSKLQAHSKPQE